MNKVTTMTFLVPRFSMKNATFVDQAGKPNGVDYGDIYAY
jgi:hypothetical protein